jgi:catechol 2,3-dioxygenase-like lactoylglutathione lyase family enzyme
VKIDHVAIGVASVDGALAVLCGPLGLREGRRGRRGGVGDPIVFVHDDRSGMKIELLETPPDERGLLHLAFALDEPSAVDGAHTALVDAGFGTVRAPLRLEPARARTALVAPPGFDWLVQLISYDHDAPEAGQLP